MIMKRILQNRSKFSKRTLKEQNLAVLEVTNFAKGIIQSSLNKKIVFLVLLVVTVNLFAFVSADTECINEDCSVGISLNVMGSPSSFVGFVKDLTGGLISGANVEILGTGYSDTTINGFYNITQELSGVFDLRASKIGFLSQTKSNQLIEAGETKQVDFALAEVGRIKGNVVDFFAGTGINSANVTLILYGETLSSILTNSSGNFEFDNLAPGYYDLTVNATGYTFNTKPDIHVLGGQNTTINFWLW